jgi:hypothetical protein
VARDLVVGRTLATTAIVAGPVGGGIVEVLHLAHDRGRRSRLAHRGPRLLLLTALRYLICLLYHSMLHIWLMLTGRALMCVQ